VPWLGDVSYQVQDAALGALADDVAAYRLDTAEACWMRGGQSRS